VITHTHTRKDETMKITQTTIDEQYLYGVLLSTVEGRSVEVLRVDMDLWETFHYASDKLLGHIGTEGTKRECLSFARNWLKN